MDSLLERRHEADCPTYRHGLRWAGTLTGYLELGYLITDHIGVAAQGRYEWISSEGSGDDRGGSPHTSALLGIARGLYYLDLGTGNAQIQFSADFGGGDGYRFPFPPTNLNHAQPQPKRDPEGSVDGSVVTDPVTKAPILEPKPTLVTDSVRSGPIVYGAGVGFIYHFNSHFAANAEVRILAAGPHFGLLAEGYLTLQVALFGKSPEQEVASPSEEDEEE
jgi:hypothetical protein